MTTKNNKSDQEIINTNLSFILGYLVSKNHITQKQFSDLRYLLRNLEDENEDEVTEIISPLIDSILVISNKDELMTDKTNFLDALAIVFPEKANSWKELIKQEIIGSLTKKQKDVKAFLSDVYSVSSQLDLGLTGKELKGWNALIEKSTEATISDISSLLMEKFEGMDYRRLQTSAPKVLAYLKIHSPEKFNSLKTQYINSIK